MIIFLIFFHRIHNLDIKLHIISINYLCNKQSEQMERYYRRSRPLGRLTAILLALSLGSVIFTVGIKTALNETQVQLDDMQNKPLSELSCSDMCPMYTFESSGMCCEATFVNCEYKQTCKSNKISEYQDLISISNTFFIIFLVLSIVFMIGAIITIVYCLRLRHQCQVQENLRAIQEELLMNQQNNDIYNSEEEQEFENYEAFLQFMIEHGYLYQIAANQKKGDQKITDSFATNDEATCPICMMEYRQEKIIRLRCKHKFHSTCIRDWNQTNSSCPVCRGDIYQ